MELSFCRLRTKDVINVCDGRNLGNITDIVFDTCCGRITGLVVPCNRSFFNLFKSNNDLFIPYNRICKIGKDIILVDIIMQNNNLQDCNVKTCESNQDLEHTPQIVGIHGLPSSSNNNNQTDSC